MKGPVRLVETGGVTAAELWRLCRERDCAVAPNLIPRNDEGRRLLEARLLCMGYALARAVSLGEEERLLCVAPEGKKGVGRELCDLGMLFDPRSFSFVVNEADDPRRPGVRVLTASSYEQDMDSLSTPWRWEFRDLPYSFTGEREGELFLYSLDFIETGLRRLEDCGAEEQAAIRAAAEAQPRCKSDWEYPGTLPG